MVTLLITCVLVSVAAASQAAVDEPTVFGEESAAVLGPIVVPEVTPEGLVAEDDGLVAEFGDPLPEAAHGCTGSWGMADPCGAGGCPPRDYVVFDVLFLDRDNATNNQPILLDSTGGTVLTTRGMTPSTAPGVRLFVGRHGCDRTGWEMGYWSAYGWYGDARADSDGGLAVPGELGSVVPGWGQASTVRAGWSSSLNVVELNLLRSRFSAGCEPHSPLPSRRCRHETEVDWIGGLFWAGLEEQAALRVTVATGEPTTAYRVATSSNLLGWQAGARARRTWSRFSVEGGLKAGLGGAWLSQGASPITSSLSSDYEWRPGREATATGMGFLSSMNLSLAYRFSEVWGLRAGYNLAWLSGVALAPNQWDFTDTTASGTGLRGAGGLFLHGANLGLEARW